MTLRTYLATHPAVTSFLRILGACVATAYASLGKLSPLDLTVTDLRTFAAAVLGALTLTVINALRAGDTRFGRGATPGPAVLLGPGQPTITAPGEPLPELPASAYPAGAVPLEVELTAPAEGD